MTWRLKGMLSNISIEPATLLFTLGNVVIGASQVEQTLMIWKVCHITLNYTSWECEASFAEDANEDDPIRVEVLRIVNRLDTLLNLVTQPLTFLYTAIAGALSDNYGSKPLMIFPLVGFCISSVCSMINLYFIETWPLFLFILDKVWCLFGGWALYYLGVVSFGANFASPENRAKTLGRFDGIDSLGLVIGSVLSPIIFLNYGFWGCYSVRFVLFLLALIYLLLCVKEPKRKNENNNEMGFSWMGLPKLVFGLLKDTFQTIAKRRESNLRMLLWLQMLCYSILIFSLPHINLIFVYAVRSFGVDGPSYANLMVASNLLSSFACLFLVPFAVNRLRFGEHASLFIAYFTTAFAVGASSLQTTWPAFFVCYSFSFLKTTVYGLSRALVIRGIEQDEIGKVFSMFSLIAASLFLVGDICQRLIFDLTLDRVPETFLLVTAACYMACAGLSFVFVNNRDKFVRKNDNIEAVEDPAKLWLAESTHNSSKSVFITHF